MYARCLRWNACSFYVFFLLCMLATIVVRSIHLNLVFFFLSIYVPLSASVLRASVRNGTIRIKFGLPQRKTCLFFHLEQAPPEPRHVHAPACVRSSTNTVRGMQYGAVDSIVFGIQGVRSHPLI